LSLEGRPRKLRGAPIAPAEIATRTHSHTASAETRHSYATHLIEDGWDAKFVQDQLGHEHASTTSLYTCVSSDYRVRTLRRVLNATIKDALALGGEETS
jgi:site-specific recombinase XerD